MRLAELQYRMRQALLGGAGDMELLALLADPPAQRERRLAVYRNNVRHALLSVLEAAFPVARQLLGVECFTATALAFIAAHPPRQPALYGYGEEFSDFLTDFQPLMGLPWLADVARLEWARNEALFAADCAPLTPDRLAAVSAAEWPGLQLTLHPSVRRLESPWAVHAIWAAHQPDGEALETVDPEQGEAILIWRQNAVIRQRTMVPGEAALLAAFAAGQPLAGAIEQAIARDSGLDLPTVLAALLNSGVLVHEP